MERLKLRFAETAKPSRVLVTRDDALGGVINGYNKISKKI